MCGIVGYVGHQPCGEILLAGLKRLESRGYDSAGIAWHDDDQIRCIRSVGNLDALAAAMNHEAASPVVTVAPPITAGVGHTRWATHGAVTEQNAHPHSDASGSIRIVLNGIIENHMELRDRLAIDDAAITSETDAEIVAHLIAHYYDGSLAEAVRRADKDLSGHYALVALCQDEPQRLVGIRRECPLVVGLGTGEQFIASSVTAFLAHTQDICALRDGDIATVSSTSIAVMGATGRRRPLRTDRVDWDDDPCEKHGYETFMLKEIHEQASAVAQTLEHLQALPLTPSGGPLGADLLEHVERILLVGCGTSYHAALAGRLAIERWARIPVEVDIASEFRYREPILARGMLVVGITQSGETADTLAAMRLARSQGAAVATITNVPGSQATREADAVLFTRAGTEIGVAATKTFVAQVVLLYALALHLAQRGGTLPDDQRELLLGELAQLPARIEETVNRVEPRMHELAERLAESPFFLYLGRLSGLPVAMEGALKLKEISYVPTDAYAAGEMKHGPIALLSERTPVICVATDKRVLPKLLSNLSEVRARGARVIAIATEGCHQIAEHAEHVIYIPDTDPLLQVPLSVVPLQLFAYYVARARGLNVDQPRNLAKTVTVE